ncbi:hypothetical protein GCM10023185_12940 [Hymenobacter saemangeumensis]|uniref:GDP-fucose protein O-fucosyltransferase n=1 Tax=Hymenobacter saemangeumensis TaxID=1084522 RepID=A0ABP8I7A3_9BACT
MTDEAWRQAYTKLNNSFSPQLVFRLGVDSGFFSEYNNMVLAMLYCLQQRIRFVLYSDRTHFALRDGWNDFFEAFPAATTFRLHRDYNLRPYIIGQSTEPRLQKLVKYRGIVAAYKALARVDYLTQDLWAFHRDPAFAQARFDLPELGWQDTPLLAAAQDLIRAFWRYNAQSAALVAEFRESVALPAAYVALHVRAGDKFTEAQLYDFREYMGPAAELAPGRQAFVLTDDYTVLEQLRAQYPGWQFHTLCEPTERGYFHRDFVRQSPQHKYRQHLKLFAGMDICAAATAFIGTYSSNPGMYLGMRMGEAKCHCLDFDQWLIW